MDCSFTREGSWFVFDTATGKTLKAGFKTKNAAVAWMAIAAKKPANEIPAASR